MNTRIPSIILLAILLASILIPLTYLPATAAGTLAEIKTSTPYGKFYGDKVVEIRIYDPDVIDWNKTTPYIEINGYVLTKENLTEYAYIFPDKTLRIYIGNKSAIPLKLPEGVGTVYQWGGGEVAPGTQINVYKLDLEKGDTVTITYRDYTVPEGVYQDVSVTLYYTPMTATLSTDRDETGIPPKAIIHLTIVDSDANKNPFSRDKTKLNITIDIPGVGNNTTEWELTETGASTEEFTVSIDLGKLEGLNWSKVWPGSYINISFKDPETGETVERIIPILITDAVLSVEPSSFGYPDTAVIELRDRDQNLDTKARDTVKVNVTIPWVDTPVELTLVETGVNTGIFRAIIVPILSSNNEYKTYVGELDVYIRPGEEPSFKITYDDTYYATYKISEAYTSFSIATPSVKFEKETYLPTDRVIVIVLENANLNDYPGGYDRIRIENGVIKAKGTVVVGNITITFKYANGTTYKLFEGNNITNILGTTTIVETGKDTGIFKIYLDLDKANVDLAKITGGKVEVKIYDNFTGDYIKATASIGGVKGEIIVDRTELPLNPGKWIKVYFSIIDNDQNKNPAAIDELDLELLTIEVYNATGHKVAILDHTNLTGLVLRESGKDTGEFPGTFEVLLNKTGLYFRFSSSSTPINVTTVLGKYEGYSMINGKIRIKYYEPLASGGYVYVDLVFKAHDAKLEVTPSTVSYGDKLTITVTAPDYNLDTKARDKVTVCVTDGGVEHSITLVETSENSGVFVAEITVGKDPLPHTDFKVGNTYKVEFIDSATSEAYYSIEDFKPITLEKSFTILSHTAKVWVQADKVSPYGKIVVYVYDPDLLYNKANEVKLALVKAAKTKAEIRDLEASKSYGNGTFVFEIPLTGENALQVKSVDTVYIYYVDEVNAKGSVEVITLTVNVVSETGVIETDKELYKPGEWLTITVRDFDRNTNPELVESVTLTLYSDSYPVGIDVTATETGPDTGVFTAKVLLKDISEWVPGEAGTLPVKLGDTVTIEYTDPSNAAGKTETITKTVKIVGAPPFPLKPTKHEPVAYVNPLTGEVLAKPKAGEWLAATIELSNAAAKPVGFDAIVIVYNETGVPVTVQVAHNVIEPGIAQIPITIGKLPAGTYTVKILLWKSLVTMEPLSEEVIEFKLTVEE